MKVYGDSKIVVKQIRNKIHYISPHLKAYQNKIWDSLINFNAFNTVSIPTLKNAAADLLATSATRLVPSNNRCSIELIFRPFVLDMITNLRVFDDDQQILEFLMNDETFKGAIIDDEEHQVELKFGNFIPKGVRILEKMFDLKNKFRNPANVKIHSSSLQFELINLGTEAEPRYVNFGKCCSLGESKFISLFKQYKYVFSWTYEELKKYDIDYTACHPY